MARRLTSETAERFLSDVEHEKSFFINEGPALRNIIQLHDALSSISDKQFYFHRNNNKNDFYNWIKNVIGDSRLANDVARAKTRQTIIKRIKKRIELLGALKAKNA
ncbi:hypothetical protein GF323_04225 [Candidatus Woesearchaeota archaeon]|nr:hypothetical protein [Candidatus Woesearchaeota archaeon]